MDHTRNPDNQKPDKSGPGLSDAELLGVIEGDVLIEDRPRIRQALRAEPGAARWVLRLREDKVALSETSRVQAPAGLVDAALERLEREALLGITQVNDAEGPIPISSMSTVTISPLTRAMNRWLLSSGARKAWAAAAVLALVGAGSLWFSSAVSNFFDQISAPNINNPKRLVEADDSQSTPLVDDLVVDVPEETMTLAEREVDDASTVGVVEIARVLPVDSVVPDQIISLSQAVALARADRLLIRVRTAAPKRTTAAMEDMVHRTQSDTGNWQLAAAKSVVRQVARAWDGREVESSSGTWAMGPLLAPETSREPLTTGSMLFEVCQPRQIEVYELSTDATPAALRSIRARLSADAYEIVFEQLDEPLEPRQLQDPTQMFWWNQPRSRWNPRHAVPVILETLR